MGTDSHRHIVRRANLELVLTDRRVGGPAKLAELLGKPKMAAHLTNIRHGKRGMGDQLAAAIAHVINEPPGWMDEQHRSMGEAPAPYKVAQVLSPLASPNGLPLLSLEALVNDPTVPEVFRHVLSDDALAPDYPRGTEIVWTTRRRMLPGRLVLVRDRHGQVHARQCHQGRAPGLWIAAAIDPAYLSFDSAKDELTLLAVYKGRLEPDDT